MKREFLQGLKVGELSLPKELIDAIMDENGKDIEAAKKPFADYEAIKKQLAEAGKTIAGFKALDIDSIKKAADDWKEKAEKAERDAATKIAEMEFNGLLSAAITGAKGKNAKAVSALLDLDALKASKNQETDIKSALGVLQKENPYLFGEPEKNPPPPGRTEPATGGDDVAKWRREAGLPPTKE